jgi:hypothetical protein
VFQRAHSQVVADAYKHCPKPKTPDPVTVVVQLDAAGAVVQTWMAGEGEFAACLRDHFAQATFAAPPKAPFHAVTRLKFDVRPPEPTAYNVDIVLQTTAPAPRATPPATPGPFPIGPWRLGMTREQVAAFADYGPYAPVAVTGGLETANGPFPAKRTNTSFVFDDAGLQYVQVWRYEGKDAQAAQAAVLDLYRLFAARFGGATVGNVRVEGREGIDEQALTVLLGRVLGTAQQLTGDWRKQGMDAMLMFDMAPRAQPSDSRLHSQWGYSSRFDTFYVFLYQDRRDAPARQVAHNIELAPAQP